MTYCHTLRNREDKKKANREDSPMMDF